MVARPILKLAPLPLEPSGPPDFSTVFERYHRWVAAIASRLSGRSSEVEDIVQDVFFLCARRIETISTLEAARPWLRTVTVRVVRKRLRRKKWRAWLSSDDAPLDDLPYVGLSPEEQVMLNGVYRELQALPVNQRLAWTLRHIEGETLEEVALACECSLATVKRWLGAASLRLEERGHVAVAP